MHLAGLRQPGVLEIYRRDELFNHAARVGNYLQSRLAEFADHPLVGEVRGKGLIGALELVADKTTGRAFEGGAVGTQAALHSQDHGLIVRPVAGSSLALCPPLIIAESQVDEIVEKLAAALDDTLDTVKREHQ